MFSALMQSYFLAFWSVQCQMPACFRVTSKAVHWCSIYEALVQSIFPFLLFSWTNHSILIDITLGSMEYMYRAEVPYDMSRSDYNRCVVYFFLDSTGHLTDPELYSVLPNSPEVQGFGAFAPVSYTGSITGLYFTKEKIMYGLWTMHWTSCSVSRYKIFSS